MSLKKLFTAMVNSLRDPIRVAMKRAEIKAAASYWRTRMANASIKDALDGSDDTSVRTPFTEKQLDRFEYAIAKQLARALVYTRDTNRLFKERGMDVAMYVTDAMYDIGLAEKIIYNGFFTRMRILLDKEVAYEQPPYQSGHWTTLWSAHD